MTKVLISGDNVAADPKKDLSHDNNQEQQKELSSQVWKTGFQSLSATAADASKDATMAKAGFAPDDSFSLNAPDKPGSQKEKSIAAPVDRRAAPVDGRVAPVDGRPAPDDSTTTVDSDKPAEKKEGTDPPPTVESLQNQYGVKVRKNGDKNEYVLTAGGKDTVLFSGDNSEQGLRDAQKELERLSQEKIKDLETKYNITITKDGTEMRNPTTFMGDPLHARTPTLAELAGLEAALQHSVPSNLMPPGDPRKVEISFIKEEVRNDAGDHDLSTGHIYLFLTGHPDVPATNADGLKKDPDPANLQTVESIVTHEFIHHNQMISKWSEFGLPDQELQNIGWVKRAGRGILPEFHILGKDGYEYELGQSKTGSREWLRRNAQGDYVDENGNTVDREHAYRMRNGKMREEALVKPQSYYFDDPAEMHAESGRTYRESPESRGKLLQDSPGMYDMVAKYDQIELDRVYGPGTKLRLPNGTVADNNKENQAIVREFEEHWRRRN